MLKLSVGGGELYNEDTGEFVNVKGSVLQLEHSLISLSKWESKWHKPFLSKDKKTREEIVDYVRCMTVLQNIDPLIYNALTNQDLAKIEEYLSDPMTATTVKKSNSKTQQKIITSELIYSWMISLEIPFEPCEKWHLNRLLMLIDVCSIENSPKKKMRKNDIFRENSRLNAARKKALGSRG